MSQTAPQAPAPTPSSSHGQDRVWASSGALFAGVLMLVSGTLGVLVGIAGIVHNDVYALERTLTGTYVYQFDVTAWGWIHLALGVVVAVAGYGVLLGAAWARVVGIVIASVYVIAQFLWLPYQPVWAVVGIGLGVFVIGSLCSVHRAAHGGPYAGLPGRV